MVYKPIDDPHIDHRPQDDLDPRSYEDHAQPLMADTEMGGGAPSAAGQV